ncbi:MAG: SDR family NAD(P)-dependent oxidoreductase [Sphingobacteriia bacterium]|nr:SDR family NAD(P)-dependent oxidoreductase [Sphingobacteriia bacterium]
MKLKNKVALITGGTSGIGKSVAIEFAKEGAEIILLGKSIKKLEEIDDEIRKYNSNGAILVKGNVKDFKAFPSLAENIFNRFKRLDILVSNAGILGELMPLQQMSEEIFNDVMQTNFTANFYLIKYLYPLVKLSSNGKMIFTTCEHAVTNEAFYSIYGASKAALNAMITSFSKEIGNPNVKLHLIDPGIVDTKLRHKAMPGENKELLLKPENIASKFVELACEEVVEELDY